jgi:hypothetical protein
MSYASTHKRGMDVLPMLIEQGKFASGLGKAALQIAALRRIGFATQGLSQRFLANPWAKFGFLGSSHAPTF